MRRILAAAVAVVALIEIAAPHAGASSTQRGFGRLLTAVGNRLDLYYMDEEIPLLGRWTVIPNAANGGHDVNGQICRIYQADGSQRYVLGEDTNQASLPPGSQGWGLFKPYPTYRWTLTGKLVPSYNFHTPPNTHQPEMTGCAVSSDGSKLFLVELGSGAFDTPGVGSLFVYFRDAQGDFSGIEKPAATRSRYCVLADDLPTAGYIATDTDGAVLVPVSGRSSGGAVLRFAPPFPANGASCASYSPSQRTELIRNLASYVPISIAARKGRWIVGNVLPGMIGEYDADGRFLRLIAPPGPYNVAGIAVDSHDRIHFASLGLRPDPHELFTPQNGLGSLWTIGFEGASDTPLPPVPFNAGLDYPEGIAAFNP